MQKEWKYRNTNKEKHLWAKRKAKKAVLTNCEANAIFADVSRRDLQKSSVYDSKGDVQTNHDE